MKRRLQEQRVEGQSAGRRPRDGEQRGVESEPAPLSTAHAVHLHPVRSGQWMEAEELRRWAIRQIDSTAEEEAAGAASQTLCDLVLDLSGVEHLDASALQILLAIRAEQERRGRALQLISASDGLEQWFGYAGARDLLAAPQPAPSTLSPSTREP